jgi:hypothetical protein
MRYLVLTPNLGLWYPRRSHFKLFGYFDADYAGCKFDRKIPLGLANFLIGPCLLVFKETKFRCPIHDGRGVYHRW